jgi:hypothetical protein
VDSAWERAREEEGGRECEVDGDTRERRVVGCCFCWLGAVVALLSEVLCGEADEEGASDGDVVTCCATLVAGAVVVAAAESMLVVAAGSS